MISRISFIFQLLFLTPNVYDCFVFIFINHITFLFLFFLLFHIPFHSFASWIANHKILTLCSFVFSRRRCSRCHRHRKNAVVTRRDCDGQNPRRTATHRPRWSGLESHRNQRRGRKRETVHDAARRRRTRTREARSDPLILPHVQSLRGREEKRVQRRAETTARRRHFVVPKPHCVLQTDRPKMRRRKDALEGRVEVSFGSSCVLHKKEDKEIRRKCVSHTSSLHKCGYLSVRWKKKVTTSIVFLLCYLVLSVSSNFYSLYINNHQSRPFAECFLISFALNRDYFLFW